MTKTRIATFIFCVFMSGCCSGRMDANEIMDKADEIKARGYKPYFIYEACLVHEFDIVGVFPAIENQKK